jgi:quercetin dioxygenase-like cupin family protein
MLALSLEANNSFAQDPTKAESAHYKLAFENEHVQVINIHYGPHEKSNMHQHPAGVVVNLTNGHLRLTDQKGVSQDVSAIHGESRWFPALKHKVENLSNTSYDAVYIGVKGNATASSAKPGGSSESRSIEKTMLALQLASGVSPDGQTHHALHGTSGKAAGAR